MLVIALIASSLATQEHAAQVEEPAAPRLELTAFVHRSFNDKYVEHAGASGAIALHLRDWFALEAFGGYLVGDETTIVSEARLGAFCADEGPCEPQLPDLWQTTWFAGGDLQWAPVSGTVSALPGVDVGFQPYAVLGGGAEGITRVLNDTSYDDPQLRISANYGVGVRVLPWEHVAVRAELRNFNGWNPNVEERDAADEAACPDGYTLGAGDERVCNVDISNNTMLQLGLSVLF